MSGDRMILTVSVSTAAAKFFTFYQLSQQIFGATFSNLVGTYPGGSYLIKVGSIALLITKWGAKNSCKMTYDLEPIQHITTLPPPL